MSNRRYNFRPRTENPLRYSEAEFDLLDSDSNDSDFNLDSDANSSDFETDQQQPTMSTAYQPPAMSIRSKTGLSLSDSTFAKAHSSAISFSEVDDNGKPLKKFELSEERFEILQKLVRKKIAKLSMKTIMKVTQDSSNLDLIDQAQLVKKATVINH